jgi:beta-lactam-binding protein with PASTA domain
MPAMKNTLAILAILAGGCSIGTSLGSGQGSSTTPASTGAGSAAAEPTYVVLPDLTGLGEADARARLASAGVTGTIYVEDDARCTGKSAFAEGQVCAQHPRAGARQSSRLAVTLSITGSSERGGQPGTSSEWVKMPDVVGMTVEQATAVLEQAGFTKIQVQPEPADCAPNIVCKQNPPAGSRARLHMLKTLFIALP